MYQIITLNLKITQCYISIISQLKDYLVGGGGGSKSEGHRSGRHNQDITNWGCSIIGKDSETL